MFIYQMASRLVHQARGPMISCLGLALLAAPPSRIGAQAAATASTEWRGWSFVRVGPAQTSRVDLHGRADALLGSLGGGVAASYGPILGMVRATDTEDWSFRDSRILGMRDYAVLAGARSRGDRLFVAGAAGIAQSTAEGLNANGTSNFSRQLAPAFDLSAHADYRVGGLALTISGVLGRANARYVAVSLGAEVGWFGF
jgi:hypothetical protein